jgi:cation diffusion facilitator family transporter
MNEMHEADRLKKEKSVVVILSIASNAVLVIFKIVVGLMTGLISVVAEALHSANDLLASLIAYFGVKGSLMPPDKEHPYGHGKIEIITGWIENFLILGVGIGIIYEGYKKFAHRTEPKLVIAGVAVMLVSSLVNWFVSMYLIKKGKQLRSVGIEVDGEHLRADVVTSLGLAAALIVMQMTKLWWIDPAGAILVGVWVVIIFIRLSYTLTHQIIDQGLNETEINRIEDMIRSFKQIRDFHKVRTRQSGSTIFVDMHVKVDGKMTVLTSHHLTVKIENRLKEMYGDVNALVHIEPYYKEQDKRHKTA